MAGFDPFEDDGYEEDQAPDEAPTPRKTGKRTTTITKKETKPVAENNNENGGLSITLKGGSGFEAPWVVLHPKDLDEAVELLGEGNREKLKEVLDNTWKAASYLQGQAPTKTSGENKSGDRYGPPQGATEHPQGKKEFCQHGEMTYKSGVSGPRAKNPGKPYQMFVCASNIEGCKPKNA